MQIILTMGDERDVERVKLRINSVGWSYSKGSEETR